MNPSHPFTKTPGAILDFQMDWSQWLGADTLASSSWALPPGIVEISDSFTPQTATIFVSAGAEGVIYRLVNTITTALGRVNDDSIYIVCRSS